MVQNVLWGIPLVVPEEQGVLEAIVHPSKEQQEDLVEPVVLLQQRQHLSTNQSGPLEVPVVLHPSEVQQVGQMVVRAEATEDPVVLHPSGVQKVVRVEPLEDPVVLHPSGVQRVVRVEPLGDPVVLHPSGVQRVVRVEPLGDPVLHPSEVPQVGPVVMLVDHWVGDLGVHRRHQQAERKQVVLTMLGDLVVLHPSEVQREVLVG